MTGWFAPFIFYLARCTENELRRQVELLKAENEILRKRVPKKRIFLAKEERDLLVKLGTAIGPGASKLVTVVHQRTYQRWIREKNLGRPARKMGRPKTVESVKEIIIRIAKETSWGYARIVGELRKLTIRSVSVGTVKNILKEAGVKPGPNRGPGSGTWNEFLKAHVDSLWQVDFFNKMIWTPTGLRQAFVLSFLHVGTRRVFCSPCSFAPGGKWMVGQAHAAVEQAREAGLEMRYLIRDRDGMYVKEFDQVFKDAQCRVIRTAPQAPNQNAFIERWVRSIGDECLNHFIVFGKKHFDFLVSSYLSHYNGFRPHQGSSIGNRPLTGSWPEIDDPLAPGEEIVCFEELGGVLKRYERRAA
ncbi:MAG: DDE-type integrase/transposase/recombinase [Pirellulales bacterium]|nr:DDE-type integrase/transposase/recombinase [Pirellulales bacterium]